jgi:hypothetical protein
MEGIKQVLLSYDLMCQFWQNLEKCFEGNPYLTFPNVVEILQDVRYAPTFIPGAGMSMATAKCLRHFGPFLTRLLIALIANSQPITAKHSTII